MGLPSTQAYISLLTKTYRSEVLWDKEMTMDQAKKKLTQKK